MNIQVFFSQHWHNLRTVGRAHPLETLWLAVYAVLLLVLPDSRILENGVWWLPLLPCWVLLYKLRTRRAAYRAAGLLPLTACALLYGVSVFRPEWLNEISGKLFCLNALALFALLFDWPLKSNRAFLSRALITFSNIVSALLVSGCLLAAVALIDGTESVLFETNVVFSSKIYYVPFFLLTPLMFLSFERPFQRIEGESLLLQNRVIDITLNYIAAPMLLVFTLLIYVYTGKIILQGALPHGMVAFVVCTYLAVGLATQLLQELSCQAKWQWLQKYFAWLTPVPLVLLWTGIAARIGAYSLTVPRLWLLAVALLLSAYCLLSLRQAWRQHRTFAALLLITGFLMGIVLPLEKIEHKSQQARFENMLAALQLLGADGKIVQPLPQKLPNNKKWRDVINQTAHLGLSVQEGEARYGKGYRLLSQSTPVSEDNQLNKEELFLSRSQRFQAGEFDIPAAVTLRKLGQTIPEYGGADSDTVIRFTLKNEYKYPEADQEITPEELQKHVDKIFAKHGLNPKQRYKADELNAVRPEILHIPLANGRILLAEWLELNYDEEKGYTVSYISGFALLLPKQQTAAP